MKDYSEIQRVHFNSISQEYKKARQHPSHLLLKDLIWSHFFADKKNLSGRTTQLLEPMCGICEGLEILKKHLVRDIEYRGFDYSEEMIQTARMKYPNLAIDWADVNKFSCDGKKYEWIFLIGGLHHVFANAGSVIKRLSEANSEGGYFLNFEPTHSNWFVKYVRDAIYARNKVFDVETEQGFELKDLDQKFLDCGYEKVDQVYPGLVAYVLYYNPDAFPWLNRGGTFGVKMSFFLDRLIWRRWLGRKLSFATITLWRKKSKTESVR